MIPQINQVNYNGFLPLQGLQQLKKSQPKGQNMFENASQNRFDEFSKKKYGLAKIDDFLKKSDPDVNDFIFGVDLTNLGMKINESPELYMDFQSPFQDNSIEKWDFQNFKIPSCYFMPKASLKISQFQRFPDETLIYIFYNFPDENTQIIAVEQLTERGWKYFKNLEIWIKNLTLTLQKSPKSIYSAKYFDINNWKILDINNIEINIDEDFQNFDHFKKQLD